MTIWSCSLFQCSGIAAALGPERNHANGLCFADVVYLTNSAVGVGGSDKSF